MYVWTDLGNTLQKNYYRKDSLVQRGKKHEKGVSSNPAFTMLDMLILRIALAGFQDAFTYLQRVVKKNQHDTIKAQPVLCACGVCCQNSYPPYLLAASKVVRKTFTAQDSRSQCRKPSLLKKIILKAKIIQEGSAQCFLQPMRSSPTFSMIHSWESPFQTV